MNTFRLSTLALSLALASTQFACSGDVDADASAENTDALQTKRNQQVIPFVTDTARQATLSELVKRNGVGWAKNDVAGIDARNGTIGYAWNRTNSVNTHPTKAQAETTARVFANKNIDLLGFKKSMLAAASVEFVAGIATDTDAWIVKFENKMPTPGSGGLLYDTLTLSIHIGWDGNVSGVMNFGYVYPRITLNTTPRYSSNDKKVIGKVLGSTFQAAEGSSYLPEGWHSVDLGLIERGDIATTELKILSEATSGSIVSNGALSEGKRGGEKLTLVWEFHVEKTNPKNGTRHQMNFDIDTENGQIVQDYGY